MNTKIHICDNCKEKYWCNNGEDDNGLCYGCKESDK